MGTSGCVRSPWSRAAWLEVSFDRKREDRPDKFVVPLNERDRSNGPPALPDGPIFEVPTVQQIVHVQSDRSAEHILVLEPDSHIPRGI